MNGKRKPGLYFAHAEDNLKVRDWRVFECTFSLDACPNVVSNDSEIGYRRSFSDSVEAQANTTFNFFTLFMVKLFETR